MNSPLNPHDAVAIARAMITLDSLLAHSLAEIEFIKATLKLWNNEEGAIYCADIQENIGKVARTQNSLQSWLSKNKQESKEKSEATKLRWTKKQQKKMDGISDIP